MLLNFPFSNIMSDFIKKTHGLYALLVVFLYYNIHEKILTKLKLKLTEED